MLFKAFKGKTIKNNLHHFTCRKCRKVEEVKFCNLDEISVFVANKLKAKVEAHQLQIEGLCSRCK